MTGGSQAAESILGDAVIWIVYLGDEDSCDPLDANSGRESACDCKITIVGRWAKIQDFERVHALVRVRIFWSQLVFVHIRVFKDIVDYIYNALKATLISMSLFSASSSNPLAKCL